MARPGKISCLPHQVRENLNRRLDDGEDTNSLLHWLNALPEVQTLLADRFDGRPINEVNLSAWRHGGFRDWLNRQQALSLLADLQDEQGLGDPILKDPLLVEKLGHRLVICFAAALNNFYEIPANPKEHWALLHQFGVDLSRMRRDEFQKQRLELEHQRFALDETKTREHLNRLFWTWLKLPEVQGQLYPHLAEDTLRLIERDRAAAAQAAAAKAAPAPNAASPQQKAA